MKKIAALVVLGAAFYVAWPAWSGYVVREAVQNRDSARLAAKVDFERVKDSLRPVVTQRIEQGLERTQGGLGATGGALLGQLRKDLAPKLVEATLQSLLTPEMIIRIAAEGGSLKESLDRMMGAEVGRGATQPAGGGGVESPPQGLGGLLGQLKGKADSSPAVTPPAPASSPPAAPAPAKPRYSLSNVKSFAFNSPLSFRLGVAKDPAATEPDLHVDMSFVGGDWKVTGFVPRL